MNIGDRVEVLLHSRTKGYKDTGGGWTSDWVAGTVVKVNRKTVLIALDEYYYHWLWKAALDRVRPLDT